MDDALQELFIGLASSGLTEIIARGNSEDGSEPPKDAVTAAVKAAVDQLTEVEAIRPSLGGENLRAFLTSAEVYNVVRQLFASTEARQVEEIEREFCALWTIRFGADISSQADLSRLFNALVNLCQLSLDQAVANGNLTAIEARAAQRHAELRGSLDSLERAVNLMAPPTSISSQEVDDYADKYCRQVATREGFITPPALDSARQLPIDSLYVPARLAAVDASDDPVLYKDFASTLFRRVVLGNPGSGKSTLAKKLASDVARNQVRVGSRPPGLVPFLVVLRDFGAHKRDNPCSIVDFVASISNSRYQVAPPPAAIEYLLLTNRAILIFDGLDELLDTTYRAEISGDVESFANLYPAVPILVTSREVGYSQAPLSSKTFATYRLAPFSDPEVRQYACNWFSVDDKGLPEQTEAQADNFMKDSASVSDLRSNALMLGLMCNLYKGSGYIPRNRPDVYEACAEMLFDRWDRLRQIGKPLNIESLLRPTMQFLAAWIYADADLQSGVTEKALVKKASEFLLTRRFERTEEAELEAKRFIEFCRGRAWVFTDTGTTPKGERLYQFTHRTFLEFFTAGHLVRTQADPQKLFTVLDPHISVGEWDVVAQLAFQLLEQNMDGAANNLLMMLLDTDVPLGTQENRLDFGVRSLEFLVPSPAVTKRIAGRALNAAIESAESAPSKSSPRAHNEMHAAVRTIQSLLGANPENAGPIEDALAEGIAPNLQKQRTAVPAAEIALNLSITRGLGLDPSVRQFVQGVTNRIATEQRDRLGELAEVHWQIGADLLFLGRLDPQRYLTTFGLTPWLRERSYVLFPGTRRVPLVEIVVANLLLKYRNLFSLEGALSSLDALAPYLTLETMSHITSHGANGSWLSSISDAEGIAVRDLDVADLTVNQTYSFLFLICLFFEGKPENIESLPLRVSSPLAKVASSVHSARLSAEAPSDADQVLEGLHLGASQRDLFRDWILGRISFDFAEVPGN